MVLPWHSRFAALPERFFQLAEADLRACDLLIILGTSLKVHPFASLVGLVGEDVPRLLINREQVGTEEEGIIKLLGFIDDRALQFDEETCYRDACFLGDCDDGVLQLANLLDEVQRTAADDDAGWGSSLRRRIASHPPTTLLAAPVSTPVPHPEKSEAIVESSLTAAEGYGSVSAPLTTIPALPPAAPVSEGITPVQPPPDASLANMSPPDLPECKSDGPVQDAHATGSPPPTTL